jgi:hypothetical protein
VKVKVTLKQSMISNLVYQVLVQDQGQHHRQGHRHQQRQRRQDKAWEVAGIVLDVPYIIRRLRSSMAIYYI